MTAPAALMSSTSPTAVGFVGPRGGKPHLIVRTIMQFAISYLVAMPRLSACEKWKRSQAPWVVVVRDDMRNPQVNF
jgi:hypothetical protein